MDAAKSDKSLVILAVVITKNSLDDYRCNKGACMTGADMDL